MARAREEDVREPALLVHDPRGLPGIVEPRRRRLAREALYTPEGDVLDDDFRPTVLRPRVVVARVEHECDVVLGRGGVGEELSEEGGRFEGWITMGVSPDRLVVDGAEGVLEAYAPVLGCGCMQRCAPLRGIKKRSWVLLRLGTRCVGDVVHVEASIRCS